ncbi:methionine ABC transporter ATP-binding protein [Thioalkalivibrio denitrificans]|uniref:Methionine ABC transporter ATP-binding protein n=1 Tax=Thioalkalivibrio denitrificans TaxID=108003 RepID=A0A1V3NAG1_9GAMM|nr:ABC transporter ATP-binding protein [Thioalkalivibrio denitrificans]OOG21796.1 methionine ABC transporter ATP-binding protein [Thioalkalivibrio denitrificans]
MSASTQQPAIEVRDLAFRWHAGAPPVLDIPELIVERGQRVFILGASGTGKSTLLNLLGGVLRPGQGEVTLLGQPLRTLRGWRRDALRADHVGFIFQMFNLIPYLDVLSNVTLPSRFSAARRERANARGGVEAEGMRLLAHLGLGDRSMLGRRPTELSVGQQQRVAAARALMGAPEVVIADEPTSALDAGHKGAFLELLLSECATFGTTLVFVSHDRALARPFDRVIAMADINRAGAGGAPGGAHGG